MSAADPQRDVCYAWERSLDLPDDSPVSFPVRKPFSDEFRAFHELTWRWGFERYGGACRLVTATPPQLRYSYRLRRLRGHARMSFGRNGKARPAITFGQGGPTRATLLHEQAHLLTYTGDTLFPKSDGHGPRFCGIALALYEEFLKVHRATALMCACTHRLAIDLAALTSSFPSSQCEQSHSMLKPLNHNHYSGD